MTGNPIREALKSTLAADSQLGDLANGIYSDIAARAATFPYVIFGKHADGAKIHAMRDPYLNVDMYMVKGVAQDKSAAEMINIRCVELLHRRNLNVDGMRTLSLMVERDFDYPETKNGETYQHVGSIYRLVTE